MCGISGFCDFSKNFKKEPVLWEHILTDMHHTLAHRGSDSFGTYLDTHVGLSTPDSASAILRAAVSP